MGTCLGGGYLPRGLPAQEEGVPARGVLVGRVPAGGFLPRGYLPGGYLPGGYLPGGEGLSCDLSHHAFDVTCMLPPLQLSVSTSAAAYIV